MGRWTGKLLGGKYRVGALVGAGGVGAVYAGVQEDLGRQVAIKILRPRVEEEEVQVLARLEREARAAGMLAHPNIIQITDFQNDPGEPAFLVMDLLQGWSLETMLEAKGPLAPGRAAFIASQVLDGLAAAHGAGILHRDLKPDNIFLTSVAGIPDIVKILDFGIAKLLHPEGPQDRITRTGDAPGTPAYMSPEQLYCEPVDQRTDLYSLGVVLYRMLCGALPFDAPGYSALVLKIVDHEFRPVDELRQGLDPALAELVSRSIAKDAADRFPDALTMKQALGPWLPAVPVTAVTGPPSAMPPMPGGLESVDTVEMADPQPTVTAVGAAAVEDPAPPRGTTLSLSAGQSAVREPGVKRRGRPLVLLAVVGLALTLGGVLFMLGTRRPGAPPPEVVAGAGGVAAPDTASPVAPPDAGPPADTAPVAAAAADAAPRVDRPPVRARARKPPPRKLSPGALRVGLISATGRPIVTPVLVDGAARGHTPLLLEGLKPGRHRVELRPPGQSPIKRTVRIRSGKTTVLPVKMGAAGE